MDVNDVAQEHTAETGTNEGRILVNELLSKCEKLLNEVEAFRDFLETARKARDNEYAVDVKQFYSPVMTEMQSLRKLSQTDPNADRTVHILKSSNLPFYCAIWEAAKASDALVAFHKRYFWDVKLPRDVKRGACRRCGLVDIVAKDGAEWIKVSTISEQRLMFELSKAQWEVADSDDSDNESPINGTFTKEPAIAAQDVLDRMELVKSAEDLRKAARVHRVRYQTPSVRFVLPNISGAPPPELIPLLDRIRSTGASIDAGNVPVTSRHDPFELVNRIFPRLLPLPHPPLSETLNVDCTILLALVSDLSHTANHPIPENYSDAIRRQIEIETAEHLLPNSLWPGMAGRRLVCTMEAARRMKEIVDTIGMPKEKARTKILMGHSDRQNATFYGGGSHLKACPDDLRRELQELSDYTIPPTFLLPIQVVGALSDEEISLAVEQEKLPPVAQIVARQLTEINRSVFLYGWFHGYTTLSSNRTVTRAIESTIEKHGPEQEGPDVWLREPARSLLGKEKDRRK